eukprot:296971-Chlamydomonas_euryale.AAC.2
MARRTRSDATLPTRVWPTSRRCPPSAAPSSSAAGGGASHATSTTLATGSWGWRGACPPGLPAPAASRPTSTASTLRCCWRTASAATTRRAAASTAPTGKSTASSCRGASSPTCTKLSTQIADAS